MKKLIVLAAATLLSGCAALSCDCTPAELWEAEHAPLIDYDTNEIFGPPADLDAHANPDGSVNVGQAPQGTRR